MSGQIFRHTHRVTYAECTLGNHVYYARYLDLLENARGEFFRSVGQPFLRWQDEGYLFPVVECRLRYKAPAQYDDVIAIELWPARLTRSQLRFDCRVLGLDGGLLVAASTEHLCMNLESKPRRIPAELAAALERYVRSTDGGIEQAKSSKLETQNKLQT